MCLTEDFAGLQTRVCVVMIMCFCVCSACVIMVLDVSRHLGSICTPPPRPLSIILTITCITPRRLRPRPPRPLHPDWRQSTPLRTRGLLLRAPVQPTRVRRHAGFLPQYHLTHYQLQLPYLPPPLPPLRPPPPAIIYYHCYHEIPISTVPQRHPTIATCHRLCRMHSGRVSTGTSAWDTHLFFFSSLIFSLQCVNDYHSSFFETCWMVSK
jgi:hypothetical protein